DRLSPDLANHKIPRHALRKDGLASLNVLAFADADLGSLRGEIETAGGVVDAMVPEFSLIFVRMPPHLIGELGRIDGVHWVESAAPRPKPEMFRAIKHLTADAAQAAYG